MYMKIALAIISIVLIEVAVCQNITDTQTSHMLKNDKLEIQIDLPMENYKSSRFDWTGKIVSVKYKDILVSGIEKMDSEDLNTIGRGFYNEFGIWTPLGFDEAKEGEYFHKIGVGLLKKKENDYIFNKEYEIVPASFKVTTETNKVKIECQSHDVKGYSYILNKEIELNESVFIIRYHLQNTGEKTIKTDEYNHNFIAINEDLIGSDYILKFPFELDPESFNGAVNPEGKIEFSQNKFVFNGTPEEQFFFGNLSGGNKVDASWELINTKTKIGISEIGDFETSKINLWGWSHVICPEVFFDINIKPGQSVEWSRSYNVFEIN